MNVQKVSIELLDADPEQPRREMEAEPLARLAGSISATGILQPIIIYPINGRFTVVDGHRRTAACKTLKLKTISAIVVSQRPNKSVLLQTQLAANCLREGLKPLEKADAYQKLKIENNWSNTELADAVNVSKSTVSQTLAYLDLPDEAKELLKSGKLSGSTAYTIARADDGATQTGLIEDAKNGKLTRKVANRRVSQQHETRIRRSVFRLGEARVTIATSGPSELLDLVEVCKLMIRECRKAAREGLDVSTFERVLADRQRSVSTK